MLKWNESERVVGKINEVQSPNSGWNKGIERSAMREDGMGAPWISVSLDLKSKKIKSIRDMVIFLIERRR